MWTNTADSRRISNKQRNEAFYERIRARSIEFSASYRTDLQQRILELQEMQKQHRLQLAQTWNKRELYRMETEAKNASLNYLLKRAQDAKQSAKDMEIAAALELQKQEAKKAKKK
jgi:hypothetical protein